jgi:hypothetical protein
VSLTRIMDDPAMTVVAVVIDGDDSSCEMQRSPTLRYYHRSIGTRLASGAWRISRISRAIQSCSFTSRRRPQRGKNRGPNCRLNDPRRRWLRACYVSVRTENGRQEIHCRAPEVGGSEGAA